MANMARKWQKAIKAIMQYLSDYFDLANLRKLKKNLLTFAVFAITCGLILFINHWTAPPAQSQITVAAINKNFTPISINPGGISTLNVNLFNSSGSDLTNSSFTDNMPTGMQIAAPLTVTNSCGGTVNAIVGATSFSLNGGTVPPASGGIDGICTVSVNITTTVQGNSTNVLPINSLGNDQVQTNTTPASNTLLVNNMNAPSVSKALSPNTILAGEQSTLTITLRNQDLNIDLTGLAVTDTLPLQVTTVDPILTNTCGGTPTAGGTFVSLTGGSLIRNTTCTITVRVTSSIVGGPYNNTILAGAISATQGVTNISEATAPLTVQTANIIVGKSYSVGSPFVGDTSVLRITLRNPTTQLTYTNVSVSDTLPAGLTLSTPAPSITGGGCVGGSINTGGFPTVFLSGLSISPGSICTVNVPVTSNTSGTALNNTIPVNAATSNQSSTSNTASASITFQALRIVVGKNYIPPSPFVGETTFLQITLNNPTTSNTYTNAAVSDILPAGLTLAGAATITPVGCGGNPSAVGNPITASMSVVTIAPGVTCTLIVPVTSLTPNFTFPNTIAANTASATEIPVNNSNVAIASVSFRPLDIQGTKGFAPASVNIGQTSTLTITVTNPSATTNYTGLGFTDNLPAGMTLNVGSVAGTCIMTNGGSSAGSTTTQLILSSTSLAAGANCTVTATVTATAAGTLANNLPIGSIIASGGAGGTASNGIAIAQNLTVNNSGAPSSPITGSKSFSPSSVSVGATSQMSITLTNNASITLNNVSFIDDPFPTDLAVAALPNVITSPGCGGGIVGQNPGLGAIVGGETSFRFSGGVISAGGTCTITMNVVSSTTGNKVNDINAGTVTSTEGNTTTARIRGTLAVVSGNLNITKSFSASPVNVGVPTNLVINVNNPNNSGTVTNLAFTDTLPAGLVVATPPGASVTGSGCTLGTVTAVAGTNIISLGGATLLQNRTCVVTVSVVATVPPVSGSYTNTIPASPTAGSITTNQGRTNNAPATANLAVVGVQLAKSFSPNLIAANGRSVLAVTITNFAPFPLNNVTVTDPLPQLPANRAIQVANLPNNASTTCGAGTVNALAGATSFSLTGGTVPAALGGVPGVCTFRVEVTTGPSNIGGAGTNNVNTIPSGLANFSSAEGVTTSAPASATLNFGPLQITVTKIFSPDNVSGGSTSLLSVQVSNPSSQNYVGVNFTDNMPVGMLIASPPTASTTCAAGIITANPGDPSFNLSGALLPSNTNCVVSVRVTSSSTGNLTNVIPTGGVISFQGASNTQPADATLTNLPGIGVGKNFSPSTVNPGDTTRLTITIINARPVDLANLAITDSLPAGLVISATPNTATNCPNGLVTTTANSVTLGSATVNSATTCSFSVDVLVATVGTYSNVIPAGSITSTPSFTNNNPVTAVVTAQVLPTIAKAFLPTTINQGSISTLTIQLGNAFGSAITLTNPLVDPLPANVVVAPTPNIGGTCTTADVLANASGNTIIYNSGSTIPTGGCTITIQVTSSVNGIYTNTIPAGALQTNIGNNPTPATANLTVQGGAPNVVLVKRITRINTNDLSGYQNDLGTTDDDSTNNWPLPLTDSLRGVISQANVRPQDEVEYTIYYLNIGLNNANSLRICDPVPTNTNFIPNAFNGSSPTDGGSSVDLGIALQTGTTLADLRFLSSANDVPDRGRYYDPALGELPSLAATERCPDPNNPAASITSNPNGIVSVNVNRTTGAPTFPSVPNATAAGTPPSSYGFVRFRVKVR